jgi:L-serine dehydratase
MNKYGLFDVVGPVMIGPSSSHTAGAAKLGYIARKIFNRQLTHAKFYLHGSFAKTYKGHGTDRALVGGVLLMLPDDENIKHSFDIAKQKGVSISFHEVDLGDVNPNSVMIELSDDQGRKVTVVGCSIGGGKAVITNINSFEVELTCEYATLITKHIDKSGAIAKITSILYEYDINIAFMRVYRHIKGEVARLVVEIDGEFNMDVIKDVRALDIVKQAQFIDSLKI